MTDDEHDREHDHGHPHEHEHEHGHDHRDGEHQHHAEPPDYRSAVEAFRAEKDDFFRFSHDSPIPHDVRHDYPGIPYYPVDEAFVFEGLTPEPYTGGEPTDFQIPTSDGKLRPARRSGTFRFEVDGAPLQLTAYELDGAHRDGRMFVPFLDATSGRETYGAGRYLDLDPDDDGTYALDFNLAYHPTCVYAPNFSCPLTPAENRLPIAIRAGERLAEDGGH